MDNKITIDVAKIAELPDNSITDAETIRQIALYCIKNPTSTISTKIKSGYEVAGLYPHVIKTTYNIMPDIYKKYIDDDNVLNVYIFGSRVYGTATPASDTDIILIAKKYFDSNDINVHVYTVEQFQLMLNRFDIQALECMFSPVPFILKEKRVFVLPVLNKQLLRVSISTITSNSWVKGKKKLIVSGDYDLNLAIKSIFHSLRILDYGIQIATYGSIQNFGSMNYVLADLKKLSEEYQHDELWQKIDVKYRKVFNSMTTQFKLLAPKDLTEKNNKIQLETIIRKYNTSVDYEMVNEILNLFQK